MNGDYLLDTNIVIGFFRRDPAIQRQIAQANQVFISSTVLGELYFGAYRSNLQQRNIQQIGAFVANSTVLDCDIDTAHQYGLLKQQLQTQGKMIPDNDIWIAAIAQQYTLTLATRDAHFSYIANLAYEVW